MSNFSIVLILENIFNSSRKTVYLFGSGFSTTIPVYILSGVSLPITFIYNSQSIWTFLAALAMAFKFSQGMLIFSANFISCL